ncbi:MAG: ribosome maturation factor RimP [Clostridia bacterium]|jgi:ribosome maturation factor RimP|nr:ribosome maturation factor RimP [Clostridia bacterium]
MSKGKGGNVSSAVWQIAAPIAAQLGVEIWDIRFLKEGSDWFLRIFLDKDGGIGIDDCEAFSRAIDAPLDELDPIEQSYCLEVSSPGLERDLTRPEHFDKNIGNKIKIKLIRPVDGVREFSGILESADKSRFTLRLPDGNAMDIDKKETSYIKLDDFE